MPSKNAQVVRIVVFMDIPVSGQRTVVCAPTPSGAAYRLQERRGVAGKPCALRQCGARGCQRSRKLHWHESVDSGRADAIFCPQRMCDKDYLRKLDERITIQPFRVGRIGAKRWDK